MINFLIKETKYIFEFQWVQKGIGFLLSIDKRLMNSSFCLEIGRVKQVVINFV